MGKLKYVLFALSLAAMCFVLAVPTLHLSSVVLGREWVLSIMAIILIAMTALMWYLGNRTGRLGIRLKLVIAGSGAAIVGLLTQNSIGEYFLYAAGGLWIIAYLTTWVIPTKGIRAPNANRPDKSLHQQ